MFSSRTVRIFYLSRSSKNQTVNGTAHILIYNFSIGSNKARFVIGNATKPKCTIVSCSANAWMCSNFSVDYGSALCN
jgi:hypothetical protein